MNYNELRSTAASARRRSMTFGSAFSSHILLIFVLGLATTCVYGQSTRESTPESASSAALTEIIVTAQRKSQNLQDVPIAVTAFTDDDVRASGMTDLEGLTVQTPGLVINNASDFENIRIRGVGANFSNAGVEQPIAQYVDGVPMQNSIGGILGLLDIDNVQVLEGPQGSLYGRNATGGAILLNTANPTNREEGYILGEYGRFDHRQIDFVFNTPLSDSVNVRFAGRWDDQSGYVRNEAGGPDLGGHNDYTLRGKVDWTPGGGWDVLLGIEYFSGRDTQGSLYPIAVGPPGCQACLQTGASPPTGFYSTNQNHTDPYYNNYLFSTLHIKKDFDDYTLTSITGYRGSRFYDSADFDGTQYNLYNYLYHGTFETISEEMQLASHYRGPVNFMAGVFYLNDFDTSLAGFDGKDFGPLTPYAHNTVLTNSASVFGELYYNITERFLLTVGGRLNYDAKEQTGANNADAQLLFGTTGFRTSLYNNAFTPRIVLSYKSDMGTYYVSRNDGFKSGGVTVPAFFINPTVQPEKITSYEMGAKLEWLGGRLRTQSDVFHYDIKDLQVEITELPAGQVTKNAARAAGTGAELNAQFAVTSQWTVEAGGAYLHARYTSYPDASLYVLAPTTGGYAVSSGNLAGSPVEQSPTFIGDASIDYKNRILDKWNVNFHAVGRYTTKYDFYPGGESTNDGSSQSAYGLVNLSAGVAPEGGHYKVGVYVNNATNAKYDNLKTYYSSGFFHMPAPPITYGMTLRYDF